MKRIHTIYGKSDLKPNYFSIGTDSRTLISNAHSVDSGEEQYETVKFWDIVTGELVRIVDFRHDHVSVSAYEKWLLGVIYNADAIIRLNLETNEQVLILDAAPRCLSNQKNNVTPFAASLYKPLVVCGGQFQGIAAYNLIAEPISSDGYAMRLPAQKFSAEHFSSNSSVLISPDSNFLLSQALSRGFHYLWDMGTGKLIRKFDSSSFGLAESLAISDTGQLFACGLFSEQIQVWDVCTGEIRSSLSGDLPAVMSINAGLLAYCNFEMSLVLWDVKSNQEICTSSKSSAKIERLALSPDGEWLASYNQDQKIEIWSTF